MPGLREAWSHANKSNNVELQFPWEIVNNSDHYEFFLRQIPITMVHTGLHDDYHSPSDDVERLNLRGIENTTELMTHFLVSIANREEIPAFRNQSMVEGKREKRYYEREFRNQQRRLGLTVRTREPNEGLHVVSVVVDSNAGKAGIAPGDKVLEANGKKMNATQDFREQIFAAKESIKLTLQTKDGEKTLDVPLVGRRQRVGLAWRTNDAEPGVIMLSNVRLGSPAAAAGFKRFDRIYEIDGEADLDSDKFRELVNSDEDNLEFLVERSGRFETITLSLDSVADQ